MKQLLSPLVKQNSQFPKHLTHPVFCLFGLRGVIAQHTMREELALEKYAAQCKVIVEIGVAEGASAAVLRKVAHPDGALYLIDPYSSGRIPGLCVGKLVAHRHVGCVNNARVIWVQSFSHNASAGWSQPIDFLLIDADHSYDACLRDWNEWSPFVVEGGIVAMHDATVFPGGWTTEEWGSVKVANQLFRHNSLADWSIVEEIDSLLIMRRWRSSETISY